MTRDDYGPRDLPLSESVPRLEMEIEELQDLRRLQEGKAGRNDWGGCGWMLLLGGGILLLFIDPITGGIALLAGILILAFFTGGNKARKELAEIDYEIKRRRERILAIKEQKQ